MGLRVREGMNGRKNAREKRGRDGRVAVGFGHLRGESYPAQGTSRVSNKF